MEFCLLVVLFTFEVLQLSMSYCN